MSLQQCHECKKDISSEANLCPNCGAPVQKPMSKTAKKPMSKIVKIGWGIFLFFIFLSFIGLLLPRTETSKTSSTPPSGVQKSKPNAVATYRLRDSALVFYRLEDAMYFADNAMATLGGARIKGSFFTKQTMVVQVVDTMTYDTVKFVKVMDAYSGEVIGWVMESHIKKIKK